LEVDQGSGAGGDGGDDRRSEMKAEAAIGWSEGGGGKERSVEVKREVGAKGEG
jgi:hypothetical protein